MCGIAGIVSAHSFQASTTDSLEQMLHCLRHRGPDSSGTWFDTKNNIAIGHTRLAILDISSNGHQPMLSHSKRYVISFNGEIYNHLNLRRELEEKEGTIPWKSQSDTETLLSCIQSWGLKTTLNKCIGMFALALWDSEQEALFLARDRMGEKPLYFGSVDNTLYFASELSSIASVAGTHLEISNDSLAHFLSTGYVPGTSSIYSNFSKLPPGSIVKISTDLDINIETYWSIEEAFQNGIDAPLDLGEKEIINVLDDTLSKAVQRQLISDVPLGAFLSGGIDSSTIVALMQKNSSRAVKTFSIGFDEKELNEATYAKQIANHLGTDHQELYVSQRDLLDSVTSLSSIYSEPFGDSSQIPTLLVSKLAREHVTVALSGDGGDELFYGYTRYQRAERIWNKLSLLPQILRAALSKSLLLGTYLSRTPAISATSKQNRIAHYLQARTPDALFQLITTQYRHPEFLLNSNTELRFSKLLETRSNDFRLDFLLRDAKKYLCDDILVKVDRAAMSHSLETRVPLLDHTVVELAYKIPISLKIKDGNQKWILKKILSKYVPEEMYMRPKQGFAVPIDTWLRGPLRDWAESLLSPSYISQQGIFNAVAIKSLWDAHLTHKIDVGYLLWNICCFQQWNQTRGISHNNSKERSAENWK